jgi:hypothetical protein
MEDRDNGDNERVSLVAISSNESPSSPNPTPAPIRAQTLSFSSSAAGRPKALLLTLLLIIVTVLSSYHFESIKRYALNYFNKNVPVAAEPAPSSCHVTHNDTSCSGSGNNSKISSCESNVISSRCSGLAKNDPRALSCIMDMASDHNLTVPSSAIEHMHFMERTRPRIPGIRAHTDGNHWKLLPDLSPLQQSSYMIEQSGLPDRLAKDRLDINDPKNYREAYRFKRLQECIDIWLTNGHWTDVLPYHSL